MLMPKYYQKALPENPLYVHGHPLRFDILETEDAKLIGILENCIARQMGGIKALSKEQYDEELKKKESGQNSNNNSNKRQWRQELQALRHPQGFAAVEGRVKEFLAPPPAPPSNPRPMPEPITIPAPESFKEFKRPPPLAKEANVKAIMLS